MAKKIKKDPHELVKKLWSLRDAYYTGNPEVSDAEFDALEDELRNLIPNHKYFEFVGTKAIKGVPTVTHRVPMLSMDKVKSIDGLFQWLKRINLPEDILLSVGPKIDGISGTLRYDERGQFNYAATRGDGHVGNLIKWPEDINGIVGNIPYKEYEFEIRGEFYIDQHLKEIEPRAKDWVLRNYCQGIIRPDRKDKSPDLKYVNFVAYDLVMVKGLLRGPVSHKSLLDFMRTCLPNVIPQEQVTLVQTECGFRLFKDYLEEYLDSYRTLWPYETDGLIINIDDKRLQVPIDKSRGGAVKFHHFNIAIKPPAKTAETIITDIIWEVSMHWRIIPTAVLKKVIIGGAEFENVTLNNTDNIEKLGIGVGSRIILERANDVIPKINTVLSNEGVTPFVIPTACPSCGSKTYRDGKYTMCSNPLCSGRSISIIFNWVEKNDIKDVGRKTIEDLYNSDAVKTIPDLYTVDIDAVLSFIPGYKTGGSKIAKINDAIQGTKGMSELNIISRIGIPMVGEIMAKNLKLFSIEDVMKYLESKSYEKVVEQKIHEWISNKENQEMLYSLRRILGSTIVKPVVTVNPKNINVVITGNFDQDRDSIRNELESKGYTVQSSVNNKTNVLLKGESSESSTKTKKAELLGVKILSSISDIYAIFP